MRVLLSPAKSINTEVEDTTANLTTPGFGTDTAELLQTLTTYSKGVLQEILGVSPALARQAAQHSVSRCQFKLTYVDWLCSLNHTRYQFWSQQDCKAAGYAFDGPAYKALDLRSLQDADVQFAQQHLRILDALYGILKPLDSIKPYRLEMSSKVQTQRGKNLYAFWGSVLSETLNRQVLHSARVSRKR